jgi:adenine C2-methylase RlmN of 23S rRNA A2503 and tRNA A37
VSTVGIIDKIRRLTRELPEISLAVSLHAPNQEMRSAIVPSAKYFPIEQLIEALDDHMMAFLQKSKRAAAASDNPQNGDSTIEQYTEEERIKESTRRRAMVEYVMLEGESSSIEAAHQLGKLCEGRQLVVNLIPYNQTDVKDKLRCPSIERLHKFRNIVASYGTFCTIRRTMGADIDSACGQLITLEGNTEGIRDIEDVASSPLTAEQKGVSPRPRRVETTTSVPLRWSTSLLAADLDEWILPLTVATSMAAACFVATATLYLKQRRS